MERYSGDSDSFDPETIMTQLRHDLADAMMDTHHSNRGRDTGEYGFYHFCMSLQILIKICFNGISRNCFQINKNCHRFFK